MVKVDLTCQYCGHKWIQAFLTQQALDVAACPIDGCGDTSLVVRQVPELTDIFGYDSQEAREDAYIRKR